MNILEIYEQHCKSYNVEFSKIDSFKSYDDSTLFCPSGMQQFKKQFSDESYHFTLSNVQRCLRLNDIDEIGDGTHLLQFNMIGFFSFREWTVQETINFFIQFLEKINCLPDYVTIHPDKIKEWSKFYNDRFEIRSDINCIWSDGNIGGYCTEFYKSDIEIGNIVNPLGTCIDVGFGFERLDYIVNKTPILDKNQIIIKTVEKMIEIGYKPSNLKQGYVLRKLLRIIWSNGDKIDHSFFEEEIIRQSKILEKYNRLKNRHSDKSKEWWFSTYGINIDDL